MVDNDGRVRRAVDTSRVADEQSLGGCGTLHRA